MKNNSITVSVVMSNYNHGKFLEARIRQICKQLPQNGELVLIDDGSTDGSLQIMQWMQSQDERIKMLQNEVNEGVIHSVNRGIQLAQGKYIALLAVDDWLLPGFFFNLLELFNKYPAASICCSNDVRSSSSKICLDNASMTSYPLLNTNSKELYFSPQELQKICSRTNFWIPVHTSLVKRDALLKYGLLKKQFGCFCDWVLIHAIALQDGVAYCNKDLSIWRYTEKNYSVMQLNDKKIKRKLIWKILSYLYKKDNRQLRISFQRSTLLMAFVKEIFWLLLVKPKYWTLYPQIGKKWLSKRIKKIFFIPFKG